MAVAVQIHANCRIRRVYFSDRLYSEDELPAEFKLYLPVQNKTPAKVRAQAQSMHFVLCIYFQCAEAFTGSTSSTGPNIAGLHTTLHTTTPLYIYIIHILQIPPQTVYGI